VSLPEDYEYYVKTYGNICWVYACVFAISHNIAGVPIKTVTASGEEKKGKLYNLLHNPNPFCSGYDLIESMMVYLELTGNNYWELARNGAGQVAELYVLRPDRMRVIPHPTELVQGYILSVNKKSIRFENDEVLHLKYFNPWSDHYGQSSLSGALQAVIQETYAITHNKRFFQNAAVPGAVLEAEDGINPGEIKRLEKQFNKAHAGTDKAFRTLILTGGLKWKQVGLSLTDMQFEALKRMNREEILAAFGVPPVMVGIFEYANYANSNEQKRQFWEEVLIPKIRKIEGKINSQLAPLVEPGVMVKFDTSSVPALQENWESVANIANALVSSSGVMTINEFREKYQIGDPLPWGDTWWKPFNLMPVGFTPVEQQETLKVRVKKRQPRRVLEPVAEKMTRKLKRLFQDQQIEVLRNIRGKGLKTIPTPFDEKEWIEKFSEAVKPELFASMEEGANVAGEFVGTQITFDVGSPYAANAVETMARKFSESINHTTVESIMKQVSESLAAGETIKDLEKRINNIFEYAKTGRSEMAARTETARAYTDGSIYSYKEAGVTQKEWARSAWDECDICEALEGQVCMCDVLPVI